MDVHLPKNGMYRYWSIPIYATVIAAGTAHSSPQEPQEESKQSVPSNQKL